MECGGKRSATPLSLGAERHSMQSLTMQPDETVSGNEPASPEAKAPSPLRSAGALHNQPERITP